ncbi:DUF2125 domain-containing protein [Acuticoccus kandeliae]|uniref:DUF2125 domain-containing protein n=1 Tax=Acuticoccus kandeliae TaxID=2073160 RepID=UPI000D3E852A|nr:DUF2125 domain-containing protein [Acuticoccus kandeliae]
MGKRSRTLRFKLLLAGVLGGVVLWSVLWFVAATFVDRQIERAEHGAYSGGALADCTKRNVSGFPFRIEVRCGAGSRVGNGLTTVTLGGLMVVAQVYNPRRLIAEVGSPASVSTYGAPPTTAEWSLARASTRLDLRAHALERFDAELLDVTLHMPDGSTVEVGKINANVRRNPDAEDDLDIALRLDDLQPIEGGEPVHIAFRGRLGDGAALLTGSPDAMMVRLLAEGLPLFIDVATAETGGLKVSANGDVTLGADGRLNGTLDVAIAGYDKGVPYVKAVAPDAGETVVTMLNNVLSFAPETTIGDSKARKVTFQIRNNRVLAGFVPLFTLPQINVAQR